MDKVRNRTRDADAIHANRAKPSFRVKTEEILVHAPCLQSCSTHERLRPPSPIPSSPLDLHETLLDFLIPWLGFPSLFFAEPRLRGAKRLYPV